MPSHFQISLETWPQPLQKCYVIKYFYETFCPLPASKLLLVTKHLHVKLVVLFILDVASTKPFYHVKLVATLHVDKLTYN